MMTKKLKPKPKETVRCTLEVRGRKVLLSEIEDKRTGKKYTEREANALGRRIAQAIVDGWLAGQWER